MKGNVVSLGSQNKRQTQALEAVAWNFGAELSKILFIYNKQNKIK